MFIRSRVAWMMHKGIPMGIKPLYIKRLGEEIIDRQPNRFGRDFRENKQGVSEIAVIGSKRVRNRVAGYITRKHNTGKKA
jgi:small subunit ribosomal protein S17e